MSNAEFANPNLTITLGETKYQMVPSFHMFMLYEQQTGKNSLDPLTWVAPTASDIATLVWAAIHGDELGMTVKDVARHLDITSVHELNKIIKELFKRSKVPDNVKNADAAK